MDIAEIFGKRITSLRNERGLSSEELSEMISLSEKTIIKLESGQRNPTVSELALDEGTDTAGRTTTKRKKAKPQVFAYFRVANRDCL